MGRPVLVHGAIYAALFALVFAAFRPALGADFVNWDDPILIVNNPHFRGFSSEHLGWMLTSFRLGHWQPLTWLSYAVDHWLWELNPKGYHLTNVALHAVNAVLFFHLARAVFRAAGAAAAERLGPAFLAALFFALHPLRVESVAWVTERRDVLSTLFLLPAVILWLKWVRQGHVLAYSAALLLFGLSLCCKAWGMTLPAVLLALDVWPLRRFTRETAVRRLVEKIPFALLALGAAVLAYVAQERSGAMTMAAHFSPLQKAAQACFGLCFYVVQSFWPSSLNPIHLLDRGLDPTRPVFLASFAGVAAGAVAGFLLRRRRPALTAALVVYGIVVSPVLGLTQSGVQLVADRYSYLATMPLALLLAGALGRTAPGRASWAAGGAAALAVAGLGARTYAYSGVWTGPLSLWDHTIEADGENYLAYTKRGSARHAAGDVAGAEADFGRAIEIAPNYPDAYLGRAQLHVRSNPDAALADFTTVIERRPDHVLARINRGSLLIQRQDYAGAVDDLTVALRSPGSRPTALLNRGVAYLRMGDAASALADFEAALAEAPAGWAHRANAEAKASEARAKL